MLYRCSKEQPQFSSLKFLLAAAGKDKADIKIYNRILVEASGGKYLLVATDLNSLHTVTMEALEGIEFEAGDYEIIKSDSKEIILWKGNFEEPFPKWHDVVFSTKNIKPIIPSLEINYEYDSEAIFQICNAGVRMDYSRLNPLAISYWKVFQNKDKTALLFNSANLQALIQCLPEPKEEDNNNG
ncbi:MAG: hypothetical protein LBC87_07390 [Fibromonadaceae bacterium]|jgi:hypothetical protein|nr:hypothetical protein [Fibromonadaceae bacterium]